MTHQMIPTQYFVYFVGVLFVFFFFSIFFVIAYVCFAVGTHLNCIEKLMQFK